MDIMLSLLNIKPELIGSILPIVILTMGCLSGVATILAAISKFTKTDADDKASGTFGKIIEAGQKLIDFLSGNVKH